ncbi:uncharacterized protein LOC128930086 [Callithrix jacchus]
MQGLCFLQNRHHFQWTGFCLVFKLQLRPKKSCYSTTLRQKKHEDVERLRPTGDSCETFPSCFSIHAIVITTYLILAMRNSGIAAVSDCHNIINSAHAEFAAQNLPNAIILKTI